MITPDQYKKAAEMIGCEPAVIRAVDMIEAPNGGFDKRGNLTVLFEPHIFYRELKKAGMDPDSLSKQYPELISPKWNPVLYKQGGFQWDKLQKAVSIHPCGWYAASYGRYQILGQNHKAAGYSTVTEMVRDYQVGEAQQLFSFVRFIFSVRLNKALIMKDWETFAKGYNGPLYKKNQYHKKLEKAYEGAKAKRV